MDERLLSVFVDESGKFQVPDALSPFYIVGLVFHNQKSDVSAHVEALDADWDRMGYVPAVIAFRNSYSTCLKKIGGKKHAPRTPTH